ncbi:beta strand repeat-containing protein [Herpetosiphon sp. NSE202]|uniref:beta strand repeat-containing protein n=1 Tax=Herpetosiphon sp. NSE202 TaxID=3351349 RepID=UPI00363BC925
MLKQSRLSAVVMALLTGVLFVLQGSGAFAAPKPLLQAQQSAERPMAAPLLGSNDVLLSDMGGLGNSDGSIATNPVVAYNATNNQYLVVWEGLEVDGALDIHGQLIDAATGLEIGSNDFLIANHPDPADAYSRPQIVWNSVQNEYLVVFVGDFRTSGLVDELEIYAQRVSASGALLGSIFRVSNTGADGDSLSDADKPAVTYNATNNQYAVVWHGDDKAGGRVDGEFEVYVQLLGYSGGNLVEVGGDVKISDVGSNGDPILRPEDATIVWNSLNNEYLVAWRSDDSGTNGDFDVYGQRLTASLAEVGVDDFLIANNPNQDSFDVNLGYNPTNNLYLVIWSGDNVTDSVYNVYGQLVTGAGALSGGLLALSSTSDGVSTDPVITYNSRDNQFIIAWMAPSAAGNAEREIFSQKINAATGARIAPFDVQVSDMGPNGSDTYFANGYIGIAYGGAAQNHTLVVWGGADNRDGQATGESEIFGQLITPILNVRKTITSNTTNVDAFDTVTYQIEVEHATIVEGADTVSLSLADAFNLNLSDVLPAQLSNVTLTSAIISDGATNTNVAGNFAVSGNNLSTTTPMPLRYRSNGNSSQKLTLVLSAKVANTALAGATVGNSANITWSNSASLTTVTGLTDSTGAVNFNVAKAFSVSKSSLETEALINQDITYHLAVGVIEGTTNSLQFIDTLPANTSYVAGSITVSNFNGMTVNGLTASVSGQTLTINASSVVNPGNVDNAATADSDVFRLSYQVKVLDVPANVSGDILTNNVNASASPSQVDNGNTHNLTIVEPFLDVSKTIVGVASAVDAGDTVRYQIQVSHTAASTAQAYDLSVVDALPAVLGSPVVESATISDGATTTDVASNFTINGSGQLSTTTATNLNINTNGTNDQVLTIVVRGVINNTVAPGATISNTANVTWRNATSLQRSNYNDSSTAPTITVPASFSLAKAVTSGTNVVVGSTVTYQLTVTVIEGTTTNLELVDTLPAGMSYVSGSTSLIANGMTVAPVTVSRVGQVLSFTTNSVLNPGNVDNSATADTDSFTITYQATVNDVAATVNGTVLINDADGSAAGVPADNNNSASVTVVEPLLAIDKSITTSTAGVDAFDTVRYQIVVSHQAASTANAFDLNLSDDMPAGIIGMVIESATISDGATNTNVLSNFNINGSGDLVTLTPPDLLLNTNGTNDQVLTLVVAGKVRNQISPGGTIANAATVTWRNQAGVQRASYTATDLAPSITIPATFNVVKSVAAPGSAVGAGATVTYRLTTSVIEGTTNNLQWVDTLPAGMSYVPGSAVIENANGMTINGFAANLSGQVLTINASSVLNPGNVDNATAADSDSFTLTYQANVAGNATSGTVLTNDVDASADPGLSDNNNQVTVTVVEPELTLSKTINSATTGIDAGDEVRYLIKVQPTATSGANATNLMITDTLPSQLTATSILSATVSDGATTTDVASNFTIVGGELRTTGNLGLDLNTNGANDQVLTVMVRGLVATSTTPLSTISNTADLTWRNPGGFFNSNYNATATAPTINVASRWTVDKFIVPPISQVSIGQLVTYTVGTTVIEGTTLNPVWVDTIPNGMTYVPGSAQISNVNGVTLNGFNVALSGQTLTISATSIVNPGNSNNAGNVDIDTFLMTYQVVVDTVAGGTVLTNDLDSSASPSLVDNNNQVVVTVVEPTLSLVKTITTATGGVDAGDTVRYQIRVAHVPSSNSNATKVLLTDTLPLNLQNLTLVSAIVSDGATSTNVSGNFSLSGGVLSVTGNIDLLINTNGSNDQVLTVVVQGTIADSVTPAATLSNSATTTWSNASGVSRPLYTATGSAPTITVPSVWSITKAISPAASTVSPGQVVEYTLTTTVLEGTTNNAQWLDSLPVGMSYMPGSAQVLAANGMTINGFNASVSGQVLTISASSVVNPGNVNNATATDSDSFVIRYQASVDNDVSLGATLTNDVDATANPSLSDNNNVVSVSVSEPALTLSVGQSSDAQLEAGDPITFTVTIDNPAGANAQTANTVAITSSFTSNLSNLNLVNVQQTGGATGGNFAIVGNNLATNTPATMPIGSQIVLTISAQVNNTAAPASLVSMQSGVTWRNPADVSLPRYAKSASADTTIASFFAVTKALVPAASTVSAGQTVTYTLAVEVIEGSTSNIVLTDTLPVGMTYVGGSGTILSNGGITLNNFTVTSVGQTLIFRVNPATNPGSYPEAGLDTDSFSLVYRATIDQSVASGTVLSNEVDATASPNLSDNDNSVSVTVVEPDLAINLSKLTADDGLDAADTLRQQIVISHTTNSLASAYDVDLNVDLPASFGTPTLISAIVSDGATSTNYSGNLGFDANGDLVNTGNINLLINTNGSNDQRLTVIVQYNLPNSVNQGATAASQGSITWKNVSGSQLPSFTASSNSLNYSIATSFALEKGIASTSISETIGNQVTFGEVVTYVLTATVLEGTTNNLRFVDTLPAGLAYTNGSVTVANANGMTINGLTAMLSGQNLIIDASSVVNPGNVNAANAVDSDSFTITYQTTVNGNPGLVRGTVLTNSVDGSAQPSLSDDDNSVSVTVIDPSLEINKVVDDTTPDFGQVLNYTITISHTAQSASTAYELAIEDTLPVGLTPVVGSLTVISGPTPTSFAINGSNIEATFDSLALGSVSVLSYQARVASPPTLVIGSPLINNVELTWTSAQGTVNLERSYLDGADAPATVTSVDLAISKRVTPQVATPGTPVTFTINLTNTGNLQTSNIVLTDIISPLLTNVTVSSQGLTINDTGANPGYVWTVSDLQPFASGSIQIAGIISPSLASDTTLVNNVSVRDDIDQLLTNNTASAIVAIVVPRINFSLANYEVVESTGSATVTVQLNAPNPSSAVQVNFATSNGTANLNDYTPVTQTLTIPRGQTSVQVVVPITNDSTYELSETIVLSLSNPVGTAFGTPITSTITIINDDRAVVYIPMVLKPASVDLVVDSIQVVNGTVRVTVRNAGTEPLAGGYWVDAYINPTQAPTAANQPWNSLGNFGMAWAIPTNAPALAPNATLTLISGGQYYRSDLSFVPAGQLNAGSRIYAQADSYGLTNYGAILETHEIYGGTYNNIRGPYLVPATTNLVFDEQRPSTPADLIGVPERPASR